MTGIEEVRATLDAAEDVTPPEDWAAPEEMGGPGDMPPPGPPHDMGGPDDPPPPEAEGALLPLNDTGNGLRFALYCGTSALVVPRVGWHTWDGRRWLLDPDDIAVRRLAQSVQGHIMREIPHLALEDWQLREIAAEPQVRAKKSELESEPWDDLTPEQQTELEDLRQKMVWIRKLKDRRSGMKSDHRSFAKTSGNKGRIDAMLTEATVQLAREVDDLNADPLTVNTETGLLRFTVEGGGETGFSRTADVSITKHARETAPDGEDFTPWSEQGDYALGDLVKSLTTHRLYRARKASGPGHAGAQDPAGRTAAFWRPAGRPQLVTQMMPVEYDPGAKAPQFEAFLRRVQPDAQMRGFLQRWLGLSMTGLKIQKFAFFYGAGANGKSVLVDLIAKMLGDYSHAAKIESFTGRNRRGGGDATPDIFPLMNARMVRASEPEEGERLLEGLIKELTGGEPILVRQLHADFIEVHPFFKLTMSGNHKPDIRGTDDGIWRRVLLVPFDVQIPPSERDEKLGEKLWEERSGILNWLIEGLLAYLEGALQEPQQVLDATNEYRADSDPIGTFLADACLVTGDPDDFLLAREIIQGFNLWLDLRGEGMWGDRTVSLKFKNLANRYRDARTGKAYSPGKRDATGYRGVKFQDFFKRVFDDAPRDAKGRPVAQRTGGDRQESGEWPT